ncbi:MAG TPA: hypothetical protein VFK03_01275 [Candidatus Saccharimonadales bacterium]|nr:hypothetical protein [Candidatus Saccharimonadales bacterium]
MSDDLKYGSHERTYIIDDNGSTVSQLINYVKGQPNKPIRNRFKVRHPVDSLDIESLGQMAKRILEDPTKLDGTLELDRSVKNGETHFYVVECYTTLEY